MSASGRPTVLAASGVAMAPGQMQLTRIDSGPSCIATALVRVDHGGLGRGIDDRPVAGDHACVRAGVDDRAAAFRRVD